MISQTANGVKTTVSETFASSPARINTLLSTNALERERIVIPAFQRGHSSAGTPPLAKRIRLASVVREYVVQIKRRPFRFASECLPPIDILSEGARSSCAYRKAATAASFPLVGLHRLRISLTSTMSLLFIGTENSIVPFVPLFTTLSVSGTSRVRSFKCAICAAVRSFGDPISM